MSNNAKKLYNILLYVYYNDCNNITVEEKEWIRKKYDPKNSLIKGQRLIESKKEDKQKSKSQPEKTIAERVKLGRKKAVDEDLLDMFSLKDDYSD